jgi:hypothetical protein
LPFGAFQPHQSGVRLGKCHASKKVKVCDWCGAIVARCSTTPTALHAGGTRIGNYYATRLDDAWAAADYTAQHLDSLERRTRLFADAFRESTLPAAVKEAASANLSTLATTTCFRTADGEFHGFEGVDDTRGGCFGNCTHVWNYETATAFLFPSFARSLRKAAFGYSMDDAGAMRFRQMLPDGFDRFGWAAADGQMGQILHAYLDWKLTGDDAWLRAIVAAAEESNRVRVGSRRMGCESRRRDGRRAAQHLRRGVLRAQSAVRHLFIWVHCAPVRRWRGAWAIRHPQWSITDSSPRAADGSMRISSTANTTCSKCAVFATIKLLRIYAARWAQTRPSIRSNRWATAAWSIS